MDSLLRKRLDPSDVVQEVFLAARQRLPKFKDIHTLTPLGWLRHVAGQTLIDLERHHLRAQRRAVGREKRPAGGDWSESTSQSLAAMLAGDLTSPSQAAVRDERANLIYSILESMDEIDREVIALRHFEELTNDEVAEVIGLTKAARAAGTCCTLRRLKASLSHVSGFDREEEIGEDMNDA